MVKLPQHPAVRFVAFFSLLLSVRATDYAFIMNDEAGAPCEGKKNLFFENLFDITNIKLSQVDEETIELDGYAVLRRSLDPQKPVHVKAEVYKHSNGRWMATEFNLQRPDFCKAMLDKNEMWYELFDGLEGEARVCPPQKGTEFRFKKKVLLPTLKKLPPSLEGTYKIVMNFDNTVEHLCLELTGDLVKLAGRQAIVG